MPAHTIHDWPAIFRTLRADGWGPASEGKTSLRKHAAAFDISPGTMLTRIRTERAKPGGGMLAPAVAAVIVDPDADDASASA